MEQKSNNSLMKKTKIELVNIILRKDEREKDLLSQISTDKTKDTTILQLKDKVDRYKNKINSLNDELDAKKVTNERLGATIKACNQNINDLTNKLDYLNGQIEDYQKGCDNCVTQTQIKVDNLYRYKYYSLIVSVLFIIAMIIMLFF